MNTLDDVTVALRPLSPAEKRDIKTHTDHLVRQLRDRTHNELTTASEFCRKATIRLIYVGFGFRIMREAAADEHEWKDFVRQWFPGEVANSEAYIAIGRHFRFDKSYLEFLVGCKYPVDPRHFDEKLSLGTQLESLEKQGILIRNPADLLRFIKKGELPEIDGHGKRPDAVRATSSVDPVVSTQIVTNPYESGASESATGAAENGSSSLGEPARPEPTRPEPVNVEEQRFDNLVQRLRQMLKPLTSARTIFMVAIQERPLEEWGEKVRLLKEDLRPAKDMLDELFNV